MKPDGNGRVPRVAGGALALVLVISIVISALLLGIIAYYSLTSRYLEAIRRKEDAQRAARSGLAYLLAMPSGSRAQVLPGTFSAERDSIFVRQQPWGLFDIGISTGGTRENRDTLVALLGSRLPETGSYALYIPNNQPTALGMAGHSQLRGDISLPERGVRPAAVRDKAPSLPESVRGTTHVSAAHLPLEPDSVFRRFRNSGNQGNGLWPSTTRPLSQLISSRRSYSAPSLLWQPSGPATIAAVTLQGNIVLLSSFPVTLDASSHLSGVLVIAPKVLIKSGFRGQVQVFARDTIQLQPDCQLDYPSALCAFSSTGSPAILIAERCRLAGVLLAGVPAAGTTARSLVRMTADTQLIGQLYTNGTLLNCGSVTGTVMCERIATLLMPSESFYEHQIVDAVIDRARLPAAFLSTAALNTATGRGVVQWVR